MHEGLATVAYLGATILFVLSLGGLSNPETARRGIVLRAIDNGKSVVTANKALLAVHGAEIFRAAERARVERVHQVRPRRLAEPVDARDVKLVGRQAPEARIHLGLRDPREHAERAERRRLDVGRGVRQLRNRDRRVAR